ncbi:tetratricopeptide repeat protein [Luteimonas sp. MC1895]|uniref:tetratricopeptide repeat protein n=1 Tax=Luteimonas sp. MC1895 TaxID=2819513 RepID=UPI0018F0A622|nr:tetratricopeptide repeat protein [Luteimonas sp. MC1895]MBJ6979228.1 tetratricopeptide repeat protein [Luteimonas sp. MC1895]
MSASNPQRHYLVAAMAAVLALGTAADAFAQARGASERRSSSRQQQEASAPKADVVNEYPAATRKDPGLRATPRIGPQINKLSEAQQAGDLAATEAAAKVILDNDKANAYERAISLRLLADLLINEDNARAADLLQQAIQLDGLGNNEHYGTMLAIAQIQLVEDDYTGALATLDRLVSETRTEKADVHVMRGNALYRLERFDEAIAALEPVVKGNPDARPDWTQLLMASYADAGRPGEATALAEQVAAQVPGDKRAQLNLANIYLQADDHARAIEVYERLRQAGELSEDRDYSNLSALYLNTEGGEAKAIAVLNEGLDKGILKGDYRTYASLAQAYYFTDQYDKAIEFYGKAAPLDDDGSTWLNLAKALANEGRGADSKAAAQKALDKGLSNPEEARKLLAR